jgi:methionyl-tRNA synthetase
VVTAELSALKPEIGFDDFSKIDLRVGLVTAAERVPKADKLLKLQVDLGFEVRTILSGIAEFYTPETMIGKHVAVVVNLAPRKIRGIESQGMLLMAGDGKNALVSIVPELGIDPGSEIK